MERKERRKGVEEKGKGKEEGSGRGRWEGLLPLSEILNTPLTLT